MRKLKPCKQTRKSERNENSSSKKWLCKLTLRTRFRTICHPRFRSLAKMRTQTPRWMKKLIAMIFRFQCLKAITFKRKKSSFKVLVA